MKMKYSTMCPYGEWLARQVVTLEDIRQPDATVANGNGNNSPMAGFNGDGNGTGNGNGYVNVQNGSNGVIPDECGGILKHLQKLKAFGCVLVDAFVVSFAHPHALLFLVVTSERFVVPCSFRFLFVR